MSRLNHIFRVGGHKGATVLRFENGVDNNLFGFKVAQINHSQPWVGFVIDEQELTIVFAIGFGDGGMVGVTPGDIFTINATLLEYCF